MVLTALRSRHAGRRQDQHQIPDDRRRESGSPRAGARQIFWLVDQLTDETLFGQPPIITEGEFDTIAAIQSGFGRVMSVPNGAPESELGADRQAERYRFIDEAPKALGDCDGDHPGRGPGRSGIALLNDMARASAGALQVGQVSARARTSPTSCRPSDSAASSRPSITHSGWRSTGSTACRAAAAARDAAARQRISGLAPHYRLSPGDVVVVTGIPGHGKTTFVNDIACRMVVRHKWRVAFASFEQIASEIINGGCGPGTPASRHRAEAGGIEPADHWIDQNFLFVVPGEDDDVTLSGWSSGCPARWCATASNCWSSILERDRARQATPFDVD